MRLEGHIKCGYYPTPPDVTARLRRLVRFPEEQFSALDPCAGEGVALAGLAKGTKAAAYGIELDRRRASRARKSLDLFVQDTESDSVYRAVYDAHPVTLLPEWAGWLTKRLRQQGWLVDLDGVGMKAGVIRATTGGLDRLVSDGVKRGEIRIAGRRRSA